MFPPTETTPTTPPARRLVGALRMIRSFLLLEDDYDVDWEVDQDERHPDRHLTEAISEHPHRTYVRLHRHARGRSRPGALPAPEQVCLSEVARGERRRQEERGDRASLGR